MAAKTSKESRRSRTATQQHGMVIIIKPHGRASDWHTCYTKFCQKFCRRQNSPLVAGDVRRVHCSCLGSQLYRVCTTRCLDTRAKSPITPVLRLPLRIRSINGTIGGPYLSMPWDHSDRSTCLGQLVQVPHADELILFSA
jgi:hypothetical protein